MQPKAYLDIETLSSEDSGLSPRALRGILLSILHGYFTDHPGRHAIALIDNPGSLRVFASHRSEFDALVEVLAPLPWVRDYARIGYPREVPGDFDGPWVAFRRYRIPTARSDRHATEQGSELRDRRMRQAQEQRLEYFQVRSGGNKQSFRLTVERVNCASGAADCRPNSYGLGTTTNTFGLPLLP